MRVAAAVEVTDDERAELVRYSRGRKTQARVVLRAKVILLAADRTSAQTDCRGVEDGSRSGATMASTISEGPHSRDSGRCTAQRAEAVGQNHPGDPAADNAGET